MAETLVLVNTDLEEVSNMTTDFARVIMVDKSSLEPEMLENKAVKDASAPYDSSQTQLVEEDPIMAELQDVQVKNWLHHKRCKADMRVKEVNEKAASMVKDVNDKMTTLVTEFDRTEEHYAEVAKNYVQFQSDYKVKIASVEIKKHKYIDRMKRKIAIIEKEAEKTKLKVELKFQRHIVEAKLKDAKKEYLKKLIEINRDWKVQVANDKAQMAAISAEIKAAKGRKACGLWCRGVNFICF